MQGDCHDIHSHNFATWIVLKRLLRVVSISRKLDQLVTITYCGKSKWFFQDATWNRT